MPDQIMRTDKGAPKPTIAAATGTASGPRIQAKAIEAAMVAAIKKCAEEGITDPAEIRKRMLAAREQTKKGAAP
jgi:hypothetical protein